MVCIFCSLESSKVLIENDLFVVIEDKFPVTKGHLLVISKRHFADFFGIDETEMEALRDIIIRAKNWLDDTYQPSAYNLGMNCGRHAGQSINHFHLHIIPRYSGDRGLGRMKKGLREYISDLL
jgi:diadenosine tetraphosphate (Ap4A) HIT family hydrolase